MQEIKKPGIYTCIYASASRILNVKIEELRLTYTQQYASFGTGRSKKNAHTCTTNARAYYKQDT